MSSLKQFLIRTLGGYATLDDALWAIKEKAGREKYQILTMTVKRLFNTIGPEDILKSNEHGQWMVRGQVLNKGQCDLLIAEAKHFSESKLWEVLQLDVKYQANRRMFELGVSDTDIVAGKLWLFTLDAFKTRLKSLNRNSPVFNTDTK